MGYDDMTPEQIAHARAQVDMSSWPKPTHLKTSEKARSGGDMDTASNERMIARRKRRQKQRSKKGR